MKLAKQIEDGTLVFVDVEDGKEIGGQRSEDQLYADGFKKACPQPAGEGGWEEHPTCWVQMAKDNEIVSEGLVE